MEGLIPINTKQLKIFNLLPHPQAATRHDSHLITCYVLDHFDQYDRFELDFSNITTITTFFWSCLISSLLSKHPAYQLRQKVKIIGLDAFQTNKLKIMIEMFQNDSTPIELDDDEDYDEETDDC